jgi:hypothetical protein
MLSDRQLRGVYGIRDGPGARVYVTTVEFWRPSPEWSPMSLWLIPLLIGAHCCSAIFEWHSDLQTVAVRAVAGAVSSKAR